MEKRIEFPWFATGQHPVRGILNRIPEDLRGQAEDLYKKDPNMHRLVDVLLLNPGKPESEILWRAVISLITINETLLQNNIHLRSIMTPQHVIVEREDGEMIFEQETRRAIDHALATSGSEPED